MQSSAYHRQRVGISAGLALATSNQNEANWYKLIAKDQLEQALRKAKHEDSASMLALTSDDRAKGESGHYVIALESAKRSASRHSLRVVRQF